NYEYSADGSVNVTPKTPENEAERLRQQIEELQQEINKIKK
ncbi:MAG: peptidase M48, partial [Dolichospermum sp.]